MADPGRSPLARWTAPSLLAAAVLAAFAVLTNIATVLNNAYSNGSTFFDSAFFQTIIWRSGLALRLPSSFGGNSFLNVHLSPINYLPNALSYLLPLDRMTFYGLVYGINDALLALMAFIVLRALSGGRDIPAFLGTLLFCFCGLIVEPRFEPHQEFASSLFMLAFFVAGAFGRPRWAITLLVLNASVREDAGILLAFPVFLLAFHAWWRDGLTRPAGQLLATALGSTALTVIAFVIKRRYFNQFDSLSAFYYPPWPHTFDHLSGAIIAERAHLILRDASYIWLPGLVLIAGAAVLRDIRLAFAFFAYLPYWAFNFFSNGELNAVLGSYKSFPFVPMLLWPAILAVRAAPTRRQGLAALQIATLLAGSFGWHDGTLRFAYPPGVEALKSRWELQPGTERAEIYRMLEPRITSENLGLMRASSGVLALYPFNFEHFGIAQIREGVEDGAPYLKSLAWFEGDRDQAITDKFLAEGDFPYRYRFIGTKLRLATRLTPMQLPALNGLIEPMPRTAPP